MELISFCTVMIILILMFAICISGCKKVRQDGTYIVDISTWSIVIFAAILIIVSTVRYGFIDTYAYKIMYFFSRDNLDYVYSAPWGVESTWLYLLYLLNMISSDPKLMQLVVAIIVISSFVYIIRKYSTNVPLSLWIFFCLIYMNTNNGMRQYFALAFTLFAFPLLTKKKYITYMIVVIIASLFHTSALFCLIIPLFASGKYMNKKMIFLLCICLLFVLFPQIVNQQLAYIFSDSKYIDYLYSTKAGMSILRLIITAIIPAILAICYAKEHKKSGKKLSKEESLLLNVLFLDVVLAIMGLYMQYWARIGSYFSFATICLIPIMVRKVFPDNNQKILKFLMVIFYFIFFAYNIYMYYMSGDLNSFRLDL